MAESFTIRRVVGSVLILGLGACAPADPAAGYLDDAEALRRGEAVFTGTCGGYCHLVGSSNADAPNLFDCEWIHGGSNRDVFTTITNGVVDTRMVGFGGKLPDGDDDVWKIVAFLKSRGPEC